MKVIDGIWYRDKEDVVHKNKARFLLEDLDQLPLPDRSIYYDKYKMLNEKESKHFIVSRGCPYHCTFCYNKSYQEMHRGKGKYIRHFSPERIIYEIKETKDRYPLKAVAFSDDAFTQDPSWLMKFLALYKQEIGLPFKCAIRANMLTNDIAKELKDAGANAVVFGIESGVETIRNKILKKKIKDEHIIECAIILRNNGIRFGTYNMFGIPSETISDAFKTTELNIRIKTDFPWASMLMPYPKTDIAKIAAQMKLIPDDFDVVDLPASYFLNSPLNLHKKYVFENIQKIFYLAVKFPYSFPILKKLVRINFPLFFKTLFAISFVFRFSQERNMPFMEKH